MKIAGLQKVSLIDYPDRVAATVFLAGCNLRCGYCHNSWLIDEETVPEAQRLTEFLAWLETRRGLLRGVCVSGGEPLIHPELPSFLARIKALGFDVKVDTNGTRPDMLERLLQEPLVDYVAMDLKAPLDERYSAIARRDVDPASIRESMELLRAGGIPYEFRTTVAPPLDGDALTEIAAHLRADEHWYLQPFFPGPAVDLAVAPTDILDTRALRELAASLTKRVTLVTVRE